MISWWWLFPAASIGCIVGLFGHAFAAQPEKRRLLYHNDQLAECLERTTGLLTRTASTSVLKEHTAILKDYC